MALVPNIPKETTSNEAIDTDNIRDPMQHDEQRVQGLHKHIEGEGTSLALSMQHQELKKPIDHSQSQPEIVPIEHSLVVANSQNFVEVDQQNLAESIHPIHRCPTDVLQYIFEWTVELDDDWFRSATRLSHVCRSWRNLAVQTARLWKYIKISSEYKWQDVRDFWTRTVERVKAAPAYVIISINDTADWHLTVLRQCRLSQLPCIEHLGLWFGGTEEVALLAASLDLPTGRIGHLRLENTGYEMQLKVEAIHHWLSLVTSLTLVSVPDVEFPLGVSFLAVVRLFIKEVRDISLQVLFHAFPNVKIATFWRNILSESNGNLVWSNLEELHTTESYDMPWEHLRTPKITKVSFLDPVTDNFLAFLNSHRSIESLDIGCDEDICFVATIAPQLRRLEVYANSCEDLANHEEVEFNQLTHLGVLDMHNVPLSLGVFEKIIQKRFLAVNGRRGSETPSLEIIVYSEFSGEWKESELIPSARHQTSWSSIDKWGDRRMVYSFKWE